MRVLLISIAAAVAWSVGCGPSAAEVKTARQAQYSCDGAEVFKAMVDTVNDLQPPVAFANPEQGVVISDYRWHSASGSRKQKGAAVVGEGDLAFAVGLGIGKGELGWFVQGEPQILSHVVGSPRGKELSRTDANWPEWADAKVDKVMVALYKRLERCAVK